MRASPDRVSDEHGPPRREASAPTASRIIHWPAPVPRRRWTRRHGHVPGLRRSCPRLTSAFRRQAPSPSPPPPPPLFVRGARAPNVS